MCDIATGLSVGGALLGGVLNFAGQSAQARAYERAAESEEQAAAYESDRTRDRLRRTVSAQRAAFSKSGVVFEGTPEDVILDTVEQGELDAAAIRYGGRVRADSLRARGAAARASGFAGLGVTALGAGGSLGNVFSSTVSNVGPTGLTYAQELSRGLRAV